MPSNHVLNLDAWVGRRLKLGILITVLKEFYFTQSYYADRPAWSCRRGLEVAGSPAPSQGFTGAEPPEQKVNEAEIGTQTLRVDSEW